MGVELRKQHVQQLVDSTNERSTEYKRCFVMVTGETMTHKMHRRLEQGIQNFSMLAGNNYLY